MNSNIELYQKKYPATLVVMQNKISQAFKDMTIDEKRLIMLASALARIGDATEQTAINITVQDFSEACNVPRTSVYKKLKESSHNLMKRSFSYTDERGRIVAVQWVIRARYDDGFISIYFPEEVLYALKVFDKFNPYTKYKKENVLSLKLSYSIDLYHLAKKYEGIGGFTMTLDEYKEQLKTPSSYDRINNLKDNAIDKPIKEINKKTDIEISYENIKRGSKVTGLKFTVKPKLKAKKASEISRDPHTADMFTINGLTDAQLGRITRNEKFKSDYNHLIPSTSPINQDPSLWVDEMVSRIKKDPDFFNKKRPIREYLKD
jgi:plasmid replication initiation protein